MNKNLINKEVDYINKIAKSILSKATTDINKFILNEINEISTLAESILKKKIASLDKAKQNISNEFEDSTKLLASINKIFANINEEIKVKKEKKLFETTIKKLNDSLRIVRSVIKKFEIYKNEWNTNRALSENKTFTKTQFLKRIQDLKRKTDAIEKVLKIF